MPCSNAAKTRKLLKFAGVPQTRQQIRYWVKVHHIVWRRGRDIAVPIVDICLSCEDIARQSCAMVRRWRFLRPVFPASLRMQHISDMPSKFALRPHHVST